MRPEILAPAGNFDALRAAVRSGADAVYFGTGNFNARRNAGNFEGVELERAVEFCHLHSVKCHITLNTLVGDGEISQLKKTLKRICEVKADALILQDLGVAKIVRESCPDIELHASTQMSTGTLEGLKILKELGFKRAVLPRELSRKEIEYIAENSPLELEMFIHGALCMSVSGQCLLSAMLGSRSGNRGLCAQPCRLPFSVSGGTGNDLSLKDLSFIDKIRELSDMGIKSFKIEGRMKRPEYVSAAVTACRESLTGEYSNERKQDLNSLFSRSGFTSGYFDNQLGREMFGSRQKENVTSATSELLKKYAKIYERENAVHTVDFTFSASLQELPELSATTDGISVTVSCDTPCEQAKTVALTEEKLVSQLSKCGGTVFSAGDIKCEIDGNISIPVSVINSMRREALDGLSQQLTERKEYTYRAFNFDLTNRIPEAKKMYVCFYDESQIPENINCDRIFLPLSADEKLIKKYSAGVMLPRGIFGNSEELTEMLRNSSAEYVLCNTLDGVAAAKNAGKKIIGGPFLNIYNSISLSQLQSLGIDETVLSYELTVNQIEVLKSATKRGCVVYGRIPLMLTRNCPVKNGKSCSECGRKSTLTDRKGIEFPVLCQNGFSEILNSRPVYMLDRLDEIKNTDFSVLLFTTEPKEEIKTVLDCFKYQRKPHCEFTRGLYYRGVD